MRTVNSLFVSQVQGNTFNQNNKTGINCPRSYQESGDSVCFKGSFVKKGIQNLKNSDGILKKILGLITFGTTGVAATKLEDTPKVDITADEWNSECKGYKILSRAGFTNELIDKTISKMEESEADSLKKGMNNIYIKGDDFVISDIYEAFNKDLQDEEKSAEITFKLLSEIFKRSKEDRIYLYGVRASAKYEGVGLFEKGTLNNGGQFGSNFTFVDKEGNNLGADKLQERFDSNGNKIVEKVDCDGNVSDDGKKYDKNNKLIEEWDEFSKTTFHYDENGHLYQKVKHMACATETLTLVNGEWKSDKSGWRDW